MAEESETKASGGTAKGGGAGPVLGIVLPALVAGLAAFGGAKVAGTHQASSSSAPSSEASEAEKPPGPTLALDPFLLAIPDANKKTHAMKVTLAIEFAANAKEESLKTMVPRIRDSTLGYLRTLAYDDAFDASASEKMRTQILERVRASGASDAQHVLITDLVVQ
jgi:flagellar basal body-associated protein FliL